MIRLLGLAVLILLATTVLLTLPFRWIDPPTSSIMWQRGRAAAVQATPGPEFMWVDRERISPHLAVAVLAAEDQKFPSHFGFDFESIADAFGERRERSRGASTITQQVAKNLYLWPGRSLVRKSIEAYLTLAIELFWPKRRILEIYLNLAEFGPNVFGAGAGSRLHFNKRADSLTPEEGALLAAVLPSPARFSARSPSAYVSERADIIASQTRRLGGVAFLRRLDSGD